MISTTYKISKVCTKGLRHKAPIKVYPLITLIM